MPHIPHAVDIWGAAACRGQLGKQITEQLLVEHVRDLAAYDAKTLVDMFGASTGMLNPFGQP